MTLRDEFESTVDGLPFFLQAEQLKPFISNDLVLSTTSIQNGGRMIPRDEFERCWPWLDASLNEFGATHTKDQVRDAIRHGAILWPGEKAAILTTMITYPIGLRCCSVWLQGGELEELKTMYPMIEKYARAQGCDWLIGWGRDGWVKAMPGWVSCGTRRKKILTE